jgi:hypothetical protein
MRYIFFKYKGKVGIFKIIDVLIWVKYKENQTFVDALRDILRRLIWNFLWRKIVILSFF